MVAHLERAAVPADLVRNPRRNVVEVLPASEKSTKPELAPFCVSSEHYRRKGLPNDVEFEAVVILLDSLDRLNCVLLG